MKVYVILGIFRGCIDSVTVTETKKKSKEIEKKECKQLGVPFDKRLRNKYYGECDSSHMNEVYVYPSEVE